MKHLVFSVRGWRGLGRLGRTTAIAPIAGFVNKAARFVHPTICSVWIATAVARGHGDDSVGAASREAEIRDRRVVFRLFCGGESAVLVDREAKEENVKEVIGKSLARPVLFFLLRRLLPRVELQVNRRLP